MKLIVERTLFLKALSHGQGVVERRTALPILSHILLKAERDTLQLTSTDLEFSIVEDIPAIVEIEGSTTLSAHMLYEIVRKLNEGADISLTLDEEESQVILCSGASQFKLSCLPVEDFPVINTSDLPYKFTLRAADLRKLFERTRFAMSTEETRYFLNGIYLHINEEHFLCTVATDGHRLAQTSIPLPQGAEGMPGVIVSRKTVGELLKLIAETQEDVQVSISDTQMSVFLANARATSRLIDGVYPDYSAAIPLQNDKVLFLKVKPFSEAVDRVATVSINRLPGVRLSIHQGSLTLTAVNEDLGAAREEMVIDYEGSPLDIGFNARYLLDVANQIDTEDAQFFLADGASPILVRASGQDASFYVLMPMRV